LTHTHTHDDDNDALLVFLLSLSLSVFLALPLPPEKIQLAHNRPHRRVLCWSVQEKDSQTGKEPKRQTELSDSQLVVVVDDDEHFWLLFSLLLSALFGRTLSTG